MTEALKTEFFPAKYSGRTYEIRANMYIPLDPDEDIESVKLTLTQALGDQHGRLVGVKIYQYVEASYVIHCAAGRATIMVKIGSGLFIYEHGYREIVKKIQAQAEQLRSAFVKS